MITTVRTQQELLDREVQEHLLQRGIELMNDVAEAGFVMNLTMHTVKVSPNYRPENWLMVTPFHGKGGTISRTVPRVKGQRFHGD